PDLPSAGDGRLHRPCGPGAPPAVGPGREAQAIFSLSPLPAWTGRLKFATAAIHPAPSSNGASPRMDPAAPAAITAESFTALSLFMRADLVVKAVMIGLALASLWSWTVIIDKLFRFAKLN